jgi:site-specific DNA recombinase
VGHSIPSSAVSSSAISAYAEGWGLKRITKELNARHVPSPRAGKKGTGSWSPNAIREMLRRETYRGMLVWNKIAKGYKKGTKVRSPRPKASWIYVEAPELRIVPDQLWFAAQARMPKVSRKQAHPGRPAKFLLSGLARCDHCGGPISANNGKAGHTPIKVYVCSYHRTRGPEVCGSTVRRPVDRVNEAVVHFLAERVLTEDIITDALKVLRQRLTDRIKATSATSVEDEQEANKLRKEIDRLVKALASTDAKPEPVIRAVAEKQEQLSLLESRIRAAKSAPEAISLELHRLEQEARRRAHDIKKLLEMDTAEARKFLSTIFTEPMKFRANGHVFDIEGQVHLDQALFGLPKCASPAGFEPAYQG